MPHNKPPQQPLRTYVINPKTTMRRTNYYFPDHLKEALQRQSDISKIPMAQIVRDALTEYFENRGYSFPS